MISNPIPDPKLVAQYLADGYEYYVLPQSLPGTLLLHPGFRKHEGEVRDTLPMALLYAKKGHLVVLTEPIMISRGHAISSPDGFLDFEAQTIEFKRTTNPRSRTLDSQIKSAGKGGLAVIRSIWVHPDTKPETIARTVNGKYLASTHLDRMDIVYHNRIISLSRDLVTRMGYLGIINLLQ